LAAMARGPQGRLGAATTADRNAAPSIRPQSERRGIWNQVRASPATLKIATRLPICPATESVSAVCRGEGEGGRFAVLLARHEGRSSLEIPFWRSPQTAMIGG
jgi:hypothetical protein